MRFSATVALIALLSNPLFSQDIDVSAFSSMEWRNVGPLRGGRSLGSAGSAARPNEYYFGATGGGLWKTTDGGNTWDPVTDGQITSSSIGAVAVSETNPDIVYIGGGETQLRGSITQGDGVYKTEDGGETWRHLGLEDTQAISRIRVHPTNPDIVYVGALGHPYGDNDERGVFRSMDGGETWKKVLYVSPKAGAADIYIDQTNPNVIYASLWQVYRKAWKMWGGGPDSGLYKSTDGGDTWTELTGKPGMPEGPFGKIGVVSSPANPNRVWAMVEAHNGGVFRSDDGGETWEMTNNERKLRQRNFYYTRMTPDPLREDVIYGLNTGLYKSVDGGVTFDIVLRPPHGDQHDLWIAPDDSLRMINSNDGGGNVSINGGKTWTEQDFSTTQLYHVMATNDFPYHICGAQQDNSTVCVPSEGWGNMQARGPGHGWYYAVGGGESGYITQHPSKLDVFYAGSQGALLTRYDRSNGQTRDIQVYPRFFSGDPAADLPERWQWTFPIVFSPMDENILYTCSQSVWKSLDDGQSWQKISPDLTYADPETLGPTGGIITMDMNGPEIYATVFALAPSFHDINTIWAGSDDGMIHITRDGGTSWTNITPPDLPKFSRVSIIDASRHDAGTAYVAANRYQVDDREPYVYRTTDFGASWTKIVSGVASGHFARAVREDPVRPGLLFLGTEHAAYVSWDAGDNWQSLQLELPDTPIRDLVVTDHDVVLGTHGRGFYVLDDIEPMRQMTAEIGMKEAHLFAPRSAVRGVESAPVQYYLKSEVDTVTVRMFDASGELLGEWGGNSPEPEEPEDPGWFGTRGMVPPTTAAGLNTWEWTVRYPGAVVFDSMIVWSARPKDGPKAPPGTYTVEIEAGGEVMREELVVEMDPRLIGVSEEDLKEQFDLAIKIRDKTSAANSAVIRIREIRAIAAEAVARNARLARRFDPMMATLTEIEQELYQVKNRSAQDPLNFPIKLNNRFAYLRRSVERGDARPTNGAYKVFGELSTDLDGLLSSMNEVLEESLPRINRDLVKLDMGPIE